MRPSFLAPLLAGIIIYMSLIHRFLAVVSPVRADILVVESWIWDRPALSEAAAEFRQGSYQCLICVGTLAKGEGIAFKANESYADRAADRLIEHGVSERKIHRVTATGIESQRTYNSALAVRDWIRNQMPAAKALNVFTLGVHARKSQLLFRKAFGPAFEIGVIAGTEKAYPVQTWWASSLGVRLVLRNTAGYLHALLWSPPAESPEPKPLKRGGGGTPAEFG